MISHEQASDDSAREERHEPPEVEEVSVARVRPEDRIIVRVRDDAIVDADAIEHVRESVSRWAGIDAERVLVVSGADVYVLRPEDAPVDVAPPAAEETR